MDLPLLLCGPILRRTEPTLVSVWVALRDPGTVTIKLWEGRVATGAGNVFLSSDPGTPTLRVGAHLQVVRALLARDLYADAIGVRPLIPGTATWTD